MYSSTFVARRSTFIKFAPNGHLICSYGSKSGYLWGPFWLFWTAKKQAGPEKQKNVKKNGHMASQRPEKWANFFCGSFFFPWEKDLKGVQNTGVYNFHENWAFGGADFVQTGPKNGHSTSPPKKKHFQKVTIPRHFCLKVDQKRHPNQPPQVWVRAMFCFVLFGLQLSVCQRWIQVPLRGLSDA